MKFGDKLKNLVSFGAHFSKICKTWGVAVFQVPNILFTYPV